VSSHTRPRRRFAPLGVLVYLTQGPPHLRELISFWRGLNEPTDRAPTVLGVYRSRHHGGPSGQAQHHQEEEEQVHSRSERSQDHRAGAFSLKMHLSSTETSAVRTPLHAESLCCSFFRQAQRGQQMSMTCGMECGLSDAGVPGVVWCCCRPHGAVPRVLTPAIAASSRAARPCPTLVMVPTRSTATSCPTVRDSFVCVCTQE
jgi:hypothetical protein